MHSLYPDFHLCQYPHLNPYPVIANFCERLRNYGMIIKTELLVSRLGANLIGCHGEGKLENNVNWAEVDAVEALIEELLATGETCCCLPA